LRTSGSWIHGPWEFREEFITCTITFYFVESNVLISSNLHINLGYGARILCLATWLQGGWWLLYCRWVLFGWVMVRSLRLSIIHVVQSLIESPLSSLVWGSSRSYVRCIVPFFNGKSSYNVICLEDCLGYKVLEIEI
jgi:hypothetical protein